MYIIETGETRARPRQFLISKGVRWRAPSPAEMSADQGGIAIESTIWIKASKAASTLNLYTLI